MDILIKGVDMPTSCWECFARTDVNIGVGIADGCALIKEMISNLDERLDDCPLVPVQTPHGDLIDRDAYEYPGDLMDEPVVIPAELAEDGTA